MPYLGRRSNWTDLVRGARPGWLDDLVLDFLREGGRGVDVHVDSDADDGELTEKTAGRRIGMEGVVVKV